MNIKQITYLYEIYGYHSGGFEHLILWDCAVIKNCITINVIKTFSRNHYLCRTEPQGSTNTVWETFVCQFLSLYVARRSITVSLLR